MADRDVARTLPEFLYEAARLRSFPLFLLYLTLVPLSRHWKRRTRPLQLRPFLVLHNVLCSTLSLYTCIRFIRDCWNADSLYSTRTDPQLVRSLYLYWLTKVIELADTVFMLLRHRNRQITFLHIFHHSTMLVLGEYAYRLTPRASMATCLCINSFVHVFLYLYYALSAYNPQNPPEWRKQLTQLQIVQFVIDLGLGVYGYVYYRFCIYGLMYASSMLVMFSDFYYKAYVRAEKKKVVKLEDKDL